jgi:hypothetical protein
MFCVLSRFVIMRQSQRRGPFPLGGFVIAELFFETRQPQVRFKRRRFL